MSTLIEGFYEARYGQIKLWASDISTSSGRDIVVHKLSRGNLHPLQDRGRTVRIAKVTLQFDEMDGDDMTARERLDAIEDYIAEGEPQIFQHPLVGSYLARMGSVEGRVGADSVITAEVEIYPEQEPQAVTPIGFGTTPTSADISAAADAFDFELETVSLDSDIGDRARAIDAGWKGGKIDTRTVLDNVAQFSDYVAFEIERLGFESDMANWGAFRALILLSDAVLAGGRAATSDVAQVFTMKIARTIALNTLLARVYGGTDVEARREQAMQLNDIRTPGWLTIGTELRLPLPPRRLARLG